MVIPQLILSGAVVNFDKLNPGITSQFKMPIIGEIMASRWVFEALVVSQFKDNPYERLFYEEDKIPGNPNLRQVTITTVNRLSQLLQDHIGSGDDSKTEILQDKWLTLKNELLKERSKWMRTNSRNWMTCLWTIGTTPAIMRPIFLYRS